MKVNVEVVVDDLLKGLRRLGKLYKGVWTSQCIIEIFEAEEKDNKKS